MSKFAAVKDEGLRRALEDLDGSVGKAIEFKPAIDAVTSRAVKAEESITVLRTEVDTLKADLTKRENEIKDLMKRDRVAALGREGVRSKSRGLELLGMQLRRAACARLGVAVPDAFKGEDEVLRDFMSRATLSADGGAGGNYTIPTVTAGEIMDTLEEVSSLLALADFRPGLPGKMDMPTLTGRPGLQHKRATVDTNMTASAASIAQLAFDPDEGYVLLPIDNRWIQMSAIGLGTIGMPLVRDAIVQGLCNDLLNADGTASYNSITGALQDATAAYLQVLPNGKKSFADVTALDLSKAKAKALKRARGPRGRWVLSQDVLTSCYEMERMGKVPVVTFGNDGMPRIFGNEVEVEELMPDMAEDAVSKTFALFGDLATYMVGLVGGIQIEASRDALFLANQTAIRGVINFDIVRKPMASLIGLRTAAA